MFRRGAFSLAVLTVLALFPDASGVGQAGVITYNWVTPVGDTTSPSGSKLTGTITVDDTGISASPISLTTAMIQSWELSLFDGANVLLLKLTSAVGKVTLFADENDSGFQEVAPKITSTSIYLPKLPEGTGLLQIEALFLIDNGFEIPPTDFSWDTRMTQVGTEEEFQGVVSGAVAFNGVSEAIFKTNNDLVIATVRPAATGVPEPASLAIFAGAGALLLTARRKRGPA